MPATIGKSDNTILRALGGRPSEFANPMGFYLQIAHISSRYSILLGQYENDSTGLLPDPLPIVRTLDTELGIFQTRNALTWSPTVEITFLGARLNLYSYALANITHNSASASRRGEADAEYVPLSLWRQQCFSTWRVLSQTRSVWVHSICASASSMLYFSS